MVTQASSSSPSAEPAQAAPPTLVARLQDAREHKSAGNDHFRQSRWNQALASYQSALDLLPKRTETEAPSTRLLTEEEEAEFRRIAEDEVADSCDAETKPDEEDTADSAAPEEALSEDQKRQIAELRSVLYANIGACHVQLGEHKEAVVACTQALKDDPTYIKALQRRAASNEILDTWSSLTAAQEDYKALLALLQPASQKHDIESKLQKLKPRLEAAQKRETSEMLDKLKGLGNSLLGNFGLSTDNFKFEPNGQGGYSMNFVR
ncbi:hypothetical protein NMY22_g2572 [Coprinellus aureogranulatus]|nr:hypothetical protein NMY22_g2572 [Coprinellus aureogranulatus]